MNDHPPCAQSKKEQTIVLLTHDPNHPLYDSWRDPRDCRFLHIFPKDLSVELPANTVLVVAHDCYNEPTATLLCQAMEKGLPTLLLTDGILEYRNTWAHPSLPAGAMFQPALAHKIACIGRSQSRILQSWGNTVECEVVGCPRLDQYTRLQKRSRDTSRPFRVLVSTAMTPYFTELQKISVTQSLLDLKVFFEHQNNTNDQGYEVFWRLTKGLDSAIGVRSVGNNFNGSEISSILQASDALITTPSTVMLEGMLLRLPVAVLDYTNHPSYVQSGWRISAPGQISQVLSQLVDPPLDRMLFQDTMLHDALECKTPAAPRMNLLIEKMISIGIRYRTGGKQPIFPANLLNTHTEQAFAEERFSMSDLFKDPEFLNQSVPRLQAELVQLRIYSKKLENIIENTKAKTSNEDTITAPTSTAIQSGITIQLSADIVAFANQLGQFLGTTDLLQIEWRTGSVILSHFTPNSQQGIARQLELNSNQPHLPLPDAAMDTVFNLGSITLLDNPNLISWLCEIRRITGRFLWLGVESSPVRTRAWWEKCLTGAGFRKHPLADRLTGTDNRNDQNHGFLILFEKIPAAAFSPSIPCSLSPGSEVQKTHDYPSHSDFISP